MWNFKKQVGSGIRFQVCLFFCGGLGLSVWGEVLRSLGLKGLKMSGVRSKGLC